MTQRLTGNTGEPPASGAPLSRQPLILYENTKYTDGFEPPGTSYRLDKIYLSLPLRRFVVVLFANCFCGLYTVSVKSVTPKSRK